MQLVDYQIRHVFPTVISLAIAMQVLLVRVMLRWTRGAWSVDTSRQKEAEVHYMALLKRPLEDTAWRRMWTWLGSLRARYRGKQEHKRVDMEIFGR
jgi:hypothetical protein